MPSKEARREIPREWSYPISYKVQDILAIFDSSNTTAEESRLILQQGSFDTGKDTDVEALFERVMQRYDELIGGKFEGIKISTCCLQDDTDATFTIFEPDPSFVSRKDNCGFALEPRESIDGGTSSFGSGNPLHIIPCTGPAVSFAMSRRGTSVRFLSRSGNIVVSSEVLGLYQHWKDMVVSFVTIRNVIGRQLVQTLSSSDDHPAVHQRIVIGGARHSILELEKMTMRTILTGLAGAIRGLEGMYNANFLHGDINPTNIVFIDRPCSGCPDCPHPTEGIPVVMDIDDDLLSRKFAYQRGMKTIDELQAEDLD